MHVLELSATEGWSDSRLHRQLHCKHQAALSEVLQEIPFYAMTESPEMRLRDLGFCVISLCFFSDESYEETRTDWLAMRGMIREIS